jgi:hypothetical protein
MFLTGAVASLMLSGAALAQQAPATQDIRTEFASEEERMMYEENRTILQPFFTDETLSELRTEEEIREIFAAMGDTDKEAMKSACTRAEENRGSYGPVTAGLCQQVMAM